MEGVGKKVAVIGTGLVGKSWAMLFAGAGYSVFIYDIKKEQVDSAMSDIKRQLTDLEEAGALRGTMTSQQQFACITPSTSMDEAVRGTTYVQECVPEKLELKRCIFSELDSLCDPVTVLASSSSGTLPSKFTDHLTHRGRCLVAHPINPPYYCPMVELCPAPWTTEATMTHARRVLLSVGQQPVTMTRELEGFIAIRTQNAIIMEAMRLVLDGVLSVEDVDKVMSHGLGPVWAFSGPFEACHLSANGFRDYVTKYGDSAAAISDSLGDAVKMCPPGEKMNILDKQLVTQTPINDLPQARKDRDTCLAELAKLKRFSSKT